MAHNKSRKRSLRSLGISKTLARFRNPFALRYIRLLVPRTNMKILILLLTLLLTGCASKYVVNDSQPLATIQIKAETIDKKWISIKTLVFLHKSDSCGIPSTLGSIKASATDTTSFETRLEANKLSALVFRTGYGFGKIAYFGTNFSLSPNNDYLLEVSPIPPNSVNLFNITNGAKILSNELLTKPKKLCKF